MERLQAAKLINETFSSEFNRDRFADFISNLLKSFERKQLPGKRVRTGIYIYEPYRELVESLDRIGKYSDSDGRTLEVLVVKLKPGQPIDRARTKQRNFVAYYLEHGRDDASTRDAALVAFVEDGGRSWRFSLVRMEYELKRAESGKVKTEKQLSPARRFSFLVGVGENTHTAQTRFFPALQDDNKQPTLEELSKAFSVETITDEFFEQYRELYFQVRDALIELVKKDGVIRAEFEEKGITVEDFAKKLLGQIVFLYFLQRKGWLGVEEGKFWGTGARDFLRQLFEGRYCHYDNFFNDILEYLFYDMLAVDKGEKAWHEKFNCRIPFLNGGLFEPLFDYDWRKTNILIPNELFSNRRDASDFDAGSGIFDVFDRFNFTVKEDEPLEKEVAVDPELLGKVFENLLEVKDRKSKGSYYTPREIVHYMCQESLLSYLETNLGTKVARTDLEELIRFGDSKSVNDALALSEHKKVVKNSKYITQLPSAVIDNAQEIDTLLANVKVCDPAVGSGAFALGMLNEIVRARHSLNPSMFGQLDGIEGRNLYDLKWHAIQESIYGVDIDPGAVEIAKLRLWLSLIVDEETMDIINPLPNLDYKIMQGNSLLETFQGTKLFDESYFAQSKGAAKKLAELENELKIRQSKFFSENASGNVSQAKRDFNRENATLAAEIKRYKSLLRLSAPENIDMSPEKEQLSSLVREFKNLQKRFFVSAHKSDKEKLKAKLEKVEDQLIETTLSEQNREDALALLSEYRRTHFKPYFLWKLNFGDVFQDKGGFDVVIGNPPYVSHDRILGKSAIRDCLNVYHAFADLYCYFFVLSLLVIRKDGVLCLITSNSYLRADYGEPFRSHILDNCNIERLINIEDYQVFNAAIVNSAILLLLKTKGNSRSSKVVNSIYCGQQNFINFVEDNQFDFPQSAFDKKGWTLLKPNQQLVKNHIETKGSSLASLNIKIRLGIATGSNEVFVITKKQRDKFVSDDPTLDTIIKPVLRGRDIFRFSHNLPEQYLILTRNGVDVPERFPSLLNYFETFGEQFKKRGARGNHWTNLRACAFYDDFEAEKIIWIELTDRGRFTRCKGGIYLLNSAYFLLPPKTMDPRYLVGILNSNVIQYYLWSIADTSGMGTTRWIKHHVERFPIAIGNTDQQDSLVDIVSKIEHVVEKQNTARFESEELRALEGKLNEIVYGLYKIDCDHRKIIESACIAG